MLMSGLFDTVKTIGLIGIFAALVALLLVRCVKVVPQASAWIIEFLGKYRETWQAGLHIKVPFLCRR